MFADALAKTGPGLDVAPSAPAILIDDAEAGREFLKPYYALYVGEMGARGKNFYNDLARYGYEVEAREIQDLYLAGNKRDAASAVPDVHDEGCRLLGRAHRRAPRRLARVWGDDAARRDAATRGAAGAGGAGAVGEKQVKPHLAVTVTSPREPPRRRPRGRHALLEAGGALVLGTELPRTKRP